MKRILSKSIPAVLIACYALVMWYFLLAPNYARLKRMEFEQHKLEQYLAVNKKWAHELAAWRQKMESKRKEIQIISKALPDSANMLGLMSTFAREAADRNLIFSSFTPGESQLREFYAATLIDVEFTGRLDDLIGLIYASRNFIEVAIFKKLSLKAIPPGNGFALEGQLETYHMPPEINSMESKRKK